MKPVLPVLEYVINYDYIVKELCENKAKPQMKCNGKCHLMKEMAKASESENPISSGKKSSFHEHETLFVQEIKAFEITTVCFPISKKNNTLYNNLYFHQVASFVFHPPSFIS
nr:hypothetical protein [Flavobacterium sp. SM15]